MSPWPSGGDNRLIRSNVSSPDTSGVRSIPRAFTWRNEHSKCNQYMHQKSTWDCQGHTQEVRAKSNMNKWSSFIMMESWYPQISHKRISTMCPKNLSLSWNKTKQSRQNIHRKMVWYGSIFIYRRYPANSYSFRWSMFWHPGGSATSMALQPLFPGKTFQRI